MTRPENYTPELSEIIEQAIESRLFDMHTGLPAKVNSFNASKQTCSVVPLLKRVFLDENNEELVQEMPTIENVPIVYPAGGGWAITWPLQKDDIVYLTFAERSLDRWLEQPKGSFVDPIQARKFDLSDAVCIPGFRPRVSPLQNLDSADLKIGREDGSNEIVLKSDGTILVGAAADQALVRGDELVTFLTQLKVYLDTHFHTSATPGNPTSPPTAPSPSAPATVLSAKGKVK